MLTTIYEAPAVITQKAARVLLETKCAVADKIGALVAELADRKPELIIRGHCNAERGSNRMEHCDALLVAGRTKMSPLALKLASGAYGCHKR